MVIPLTVFCDGGAVTKPLSSRPPGMSVRFEDSRNRPCPPPLVVRLLAVGGDLLAVTQQFQTPRVLLDAFDGAVEVGSLAVRGEDVLVEEVAYTALAQFSCVSGRN